jgi:hypothetical protein
MAAIFLPCFSAGNDSTMLNYMEYKASGKVFVKTLAVTSVALVCIVGSSILGGVASFGLSTRPHPPSRR